MRLAKITGGLAVAVLAGTAGAGLEAVTAGRPGPVVVTVTTVCHAAEEDTAITDCDYRRAPDGTGGWYPRVKS